MHRRRYQLVATLMLLVLFALLPTSANANWGAGGVCSLNNAHHCYTLTQNHSLSRLGFILYVDTTAAEVPCCGFIDNEMWISDVQHGYGGWIETGSTVEASGCCGVHEFAAEEQRGKYWENVNPTPVYANLYERYMILDTEDNGAWHIYYSGPGSCAGWCEVFRLGGGWPTHFTEVEIGGEAADEVVPLSQARDQAAVTNTSVALHEQGWESWPADSWYLTHGATGAAISRNNENPIAGNIAWTLGASCLCEGSVIAAATKQEPEPTVVSRTTGTLPNGNTIETMIAEKSFHPVLRVPPGHQPPQGKVETLIHNKAGQFVARFLGSTPPTTAEIMEREMPNSLVEMR